ncbi:hypothetical protein VE01_07495 [Pseudogymnoascus verrucosus]|uniref:SET domain-containing protein n=1 Tax=Pseudogymnoascus verrucosus TaxID=342668 RepID=A0A1B8GGL8_9PEZI|nr:uncharacterized protein VE01_07495 [Pseudogymnoascus verrucosus]OBT94989.1 hypothetical protein VE01_07495 [Pseudogymnoascus verrucosus]
MTERTFSIPPPIAQSQPVSQSPVTANPRSAPGAATDSVDEEPYTIKCICDYSDDDGNTIYCERCDTWQHIECFYPGNVEEASRDDFSHFCADCDPRPLDRRKAHERQREQRQDKLRQDDVDKKTKRPPSKSHKKKPKPSDVVTNGIHDHDPHHGAKAGSPHDHTSHAKKPKSHQRSQQSISAAKRSPSNHSRNHSHAHPLSPATTPPDLPQDFIIHTYSKQFQDLCENDPGPQDLQANSFASLAVTDSMSNWLRDPQKLQEDVGIQNSQDVFRTIKPEVDFDNYPRPKLQVNSKTISTKPELQLRYLTVSETLRQKETIIGELKGLVGFQSTFVELEGETYTKLCHPPPFVFFHPHLPLYIDTRKEGTQCRYVRRSCRPNSILETYITNGSEYHFCFQTEQPLAANAQITLGWDFKFRNGKRFVHLLGIEDDNGTEPEITEQEYDELSDLITSVLSDYGGCACDAGNDCAFVRFHRNFRSKLQQVQTQPTKPKKQRKPKQHVSPISTGHATNSRDASEGRQEVYDAEDDSRSASGSIKPRSRDMTPLTAGLDANGTELVSDRDKRKLADIEKTFEQMDKQPPRKKKRGSDGPILPTPANGHPPNQRTKHKSVSRTNTSISTSMQANGTTQFQKDKNRHSRHPSESPTTEVSPKTMGAASSKPASRYGSVPARSRQLSPVRKSNYVDADTQTDPEPDAWYTQTPKPKKKFVPLSRRLVENQRKAFAVQESRIASLMSQMEMSRMEGVESTAGSHPPSPEAKTAPKPEGVPLANGVRVGVGSVEPPGSEDGKSVADHAEGAADVPMPDAPSASPEAAKAPPPTWPGVLHPPPPATASIPADQKSPDLKIQMPASATPFSAAAAAAVASPSTASTPFPLYSPAGSIAQSPMGTSYPSAFSPSVLSSVGQHPPPIKKKLSLSAYNAMRKKLPEASKSETPKVELSKAEPAQTESAQAELPKAEPVEQESKSLPPPPPTETKDASAALVGDGEQKGVSETPVPVPTPTPAAATDAKASEPQISEPAKDTTTTDDKTLSNGDTTTSGNDNAATAAV